MSKPVLVVDDLWVEYPARRGVVKAVRGVSFELHEGETLALIGESGSGKTTLGLALVRLLPKAARIKHGRILYLGSHSSTSRSTSTSSVDVLALSTEQLRQFRWRDCAMVFQGAQNALNPVLRVEAQFIDTAKAHGMNDAAQVRRRAVELLKMVQLDPARVLYSYPHELSGGMRQRVLIALGLLLSPRVIILDEPTTALDILTQRSVIEVLRKLRSEFSFSLIFISHDLSLAAELADRVATIYAGEIVEIGDVYDLFEQPRHPYTMALTRAVPTVTGEMHDLIAISGSPPDLINPPSGCAFHPRCPFATDVCRESEPRLERVSTNGANGMNGKEQLAACFHTDEVARALSVSDKSEGSFIPFDAVKN